MLTLKFRIPYKEGRAEDICDRLSKALVNNPEAQVIIVDSQLELRVATRPEDEIEMDLRLLEIT